MTRLRVVVAVGTHEQPFARLLDIAEHCAEAVEGVEWVVQSGAVQRELDWALETQPYFAHGELLARIAAADLVLSHASPGTVFDALAGESQPLVVPRRCEYGEHVNDHQFRFARRLADLDLAWTADDADIAAAAIQRAAAEEVELRRARVRAAYASSVERTSRFVERFGGAVDALLAEGGRSPTAVHS
jgi:UDP-N-acetylglucosamine transferase subunit ALG13